MRSIDKGVGSGIIQAVRGKAVGEANGPQTGIAARFNVDVGIPDHDRFFRLGAKFVQQLLRARGIGLLRREAVSAIDLGEEWAEAERLYDDARRLYRLIGQNGESAGTPFFLDAGRFGGCCIDARASSIPEYTVV